MTSDDTSSRAPLPSLAPLARGGLDRSAAERTQPDLLERLRADAGTRVLPAHADRAPLDEAGRLLLVAPHDVAEHARWAFLGRDADGTALLVAATAAEEPAPVEAERWGALRAVGGDLPADQSGAFVEAVSLGRWLVDAPHCAGCGARLEDRQAGWARRCPACDREHFPRTDPAVIVGVISSDGERLLLGRNALWAAANMFSTFAGFVEAGESLETTIVREVEEEAGVRVARLEYRGSQAWPYPRSLMLGFHAHAIDDAEARADGEEIVEVRWFTREELRAGLRGEADFGLPGAASIAHRLIVDWVEERP
ncbi:NAD(+) diphosphatase [Microbacterium sp. No. 7]|uniref:NAD(+) diphosphatase n=1 Tax=Microbacterium sp. No. 7 TaxID=1714373 RepID=UPI0006D0AB62|nr:NAD(+) diphosphatase [Microbacterium sp. No. 7]ALJ19965.1 NTP pyrophosphohydrolase [Microbacterium sp. No. 7]